MVDIGTSISGMTADTTFPDDAYTPMISASLSAIGNYKQLYTARINLLTGTTMASGHLGTFTGSTIADSSSIKTALQALETATELRPTSATLAATGGSALIGTLQSGTGADLRTVEAKLRDIVSVKDFSAAGDGSADDTSELQDAITASEADGNRANYIPNGVYKTTSVLTVHQGVSLIGSGSQGSNEACGVVFKNASTGNFMTFDGNGTSAKGTGAKLSDLLIVKDDTYQGGIALNIVATSDNFRPGEMLLDRILTYGIGSTAGAGGNGGLWAKGLFVDGSLCNTAGSRGVRHLHVRDCRFAEATTTGKTVHLKQVTHFHATNLSIDQGDASSAQGVYLEGINDDVFITGGNIGGTFEIIASDASNTTNNFHFQGRIGSTFISNDLQTNGTLVASFSDSGGLVLVNKSPSLVCLTNINPDMALNTSATLTNVTGDNTTYTVVWNTEKRDRGNLISGSVTAMTCYCAGTYLVHACLALSELGAAHTGFELSIVHTKALGGTDTYTRTGNPGAIRNAANNASVEISQPVALLHGDTIAITIAVSGSTKTVDVYGSATPFFSVFSAKYLP